MNPRAKHRRTKGRGVGWRAGFNLRPCWAIWALVAISIANGCTRSRLDHDLCPIDPKPQHTTVLLVDTSDPLALKHREKLRTLIRELQDPSDAEGNYASHKIEPGEELVVYELAADLAELEPAIRVCNPGGNPDTRTIVDDLTSGRTIELRRWNDFRARLERLFDQQGQSTLPRSLILETIGVVTARHASSLRALDQNTHRMHLILYSDLLQHSSAGGLSHYGPYPQPEALLTQAGLRHLKSDLSAVDVSIYRLERNSIDAARWQTKEHYYWWEDLVHTFGGQVIWIESI